MISNCAMFLFTGDLKLPCRLTNEATKESKNKAPIIYSIIIKITNIFSKLS